MQWAFPTFCPVRKAAHALRMLHSSSSRQAQAPAAHDRGFRSSFIPWTHRRRNEAVVVELHVGSTRLCIPVLIRPH